MYIILYCKPQIITVHDPITVFLIVLGFFLVGLFSCVSCLEKFL